MKLSVIVPVYNVEKFLPRCLDSLLRQGMEDGEYEIICVNDGSPDRSGDILATYKQRYPGIFRIITQENQGLGGARNTGTAAARGKWVAYLDSDDYVIDGAYRYLLDHFCVKKNEIRKEWKSKDYESDGSDEQEGWEPDVVCFASCNIYTDGISLADPDAKPDGEITYEGDGVEAYNRWTLHYVWSKLYRRTFLVENHIESVLMICEDELWNFDVFRHHPRTRIVTSKVVRYENGNTQSIMKITSREVVLVQLNDLYYNMLIVRRYLDEGNTELAPAAHRLLGGYRKIYYTKMLNANLNRNDWKRYTQILNVSKMGENALEYENSLAGKVIALLKYMAGHSYFEYCLVRFIHRNIFKRFLFRHLITR